MVRKTSGTVAVRSKAKLDVVPVSVRVATAKDIPAITIIFNQGVDDKVATLDGRHTVTQRMAWFRAHVATEPVVVAERDGEIVGWASLNKYAQRACFDLVKELSIYVRRDLRSHGIGDTLMKALLEHGRMARVHKVVLFVFPTNRQAIALYRKNGFVKVGVFHDYGYRDGEWLDSMAMEQILIPD